MNTSSFFKKITENYLALLKLVKTELPHDLIISFLEIDPKSNNTFPKNYLFLFIKAIVTVQSYKVNINCFCVSR